MPNIIIPMLLRLTEFYVISHNHNSIGLKWPFVISKLLLLKSRVVLSVFVLWQYANYTFLLLIAITRNFRACANLEGSHQGICKWWAFVRQMRYLLCSSIAKVPCTSPVYSNGSRKCSAPSTRHRRSRRPPRSVGIATKTIVNPQSLTETTVTASLDRNCWTMKRSI